MKRTFTLLSLSFFPFLNIFSQSCIETGINGSVVNLSCSQTCTDFRFQLPHLKSTGTYVFNTIPYTPFPYLVSTGGTEDPSLYADDTYSNVFSLPFPFCFYDSTFTKAVIGSNGLITFDTLNGGCSNAYTMANTIPYAGGTRCSGIAPDYYPKSAIMGMFTDLDPRYDPPNSNIHAPADRKIQWRVEGSAPCRKFIVSYYHIGTFGDDCGLSVDSSNTFQMVMYESTGLIDVYILNKSCFSSTNAPGWAIMGVQNWNQNMAVAAPGKNLTTWTAHTQGYRFTPNGGTSRFVSSQLFTLAGTLVGSADTSTTVPGLLNIGFPNICPGVTTQYVIKTVYNACPTGALLISYDTITIVHINTLTGATTTTPSTCGVSVGTVTATVTGGVGTPPFSYTITPGGNTNSTGVFTGLAAGSYSISITDAVSCPVILTATVTAISSLAGTAATTGTACTGVNNGTITITPQGNPPYSYTLTGPGGPYTQSTPVFTNLNSGTYNLSYVDVNNCAGTIANIVVASGGTIGASNTHTNSTCSGANDGTITITPTVVGSHTFTITPGGTTNTTGVFTGLAPATYSVSFTNTTSGCVGNVTGVTIAQGSTIPATWFRTNESCPNVHDGTIQVNPSAAGSYTYTLTPGPVTNTTGFFTGLSAGVFYNVSFNNLTSGCGGALTSLFVQASTAVISGAASHTDVSCAGAGDGTITITPTPAGAYTYTITPGGTSNNTGIFTGLGPNTYSVSFVNAGGCGATVNNIVVTSATGVAASSTHTDATCAGVNNGTITVLPPATGGPFTYTLNPGNVVHANNPVFTNLPAGNYTITFTNAGGCGGTVTPAPVVGEGAAPVATATHTDASCTGVNNGSVTVVPPAAGGPFIYTLNPGNIVHNNNPVFTGLAAGTYTITFSNATGCIGSVSPSPVVSSGTVPNTASVAVAATCPGVNNGTITVTPPATGGPFTYTLNPGAVTNSTGIFNGLATATYTITYTNAVGCVGNISPNPVVGAGSNPTATATGGVTTCPGVANGTVTVMPPATGGPFVYTLNPGSVSNSTGIFTGLAAATYTITFTTAAGCNGTVPVNPVVTTGPAPVATATHVNTTCPGANNGTITVVPPAAGGPFTYTLNPGNIVQNNNPVFTGLAAGTYTINFTTALGCSGTVTGNLTVAEGPAPTATTSHVNTTCPGANDGTITVIPPATGGPFTFTLNPGAVTNSTGTFTGLAAAVYTITFINSFGCNGTTTGTITITNGPAPVATATHINTTCPGADDGTITIVAPATGGPFTYTLNPGAVTNSTGTFTGLAPAAYTITFMNSLGCNGTVTGNTTVANGLAPTATATHVNTTCPGADDGTITIVPPATGGPFTYTLNPGAVTNSTGTFTGLTPAAYTATFINSLGCNGTVTGNITVANGLAPTATATHVNTTCPGANDGTITIIPPATGAPFIYTLNPGNVIQNNNPVFTGLAPNTYVISYVNSFGCSGTVTGNTVVINGGAPTATATHTNTTCAQVNDGTITVISPPTGSPFVYTLNPGNVIQNNNPVFTNLAAGTYTISFVNSFGCSGTVTGSLTVANGAAPAATATHSNTTCAQINDGTISVTPPATGGPFIYTLNPGNNTQNNNPVFTGLSAGTYTISFTTALGCIGTVAGNIVVTNGAAPTTTATSTSTTCPGVNDGVINVTPPTAGGPFVYTLNPGNIIHNNNPVFTGLAPGAYTISFTTAPGCVGTVPGNINLSAGAPITATSTAVNPPCANINDGTLTIVPTVGGVYSYTLNPGLPTQIIQPGNAAFTNLAPGTYTYSFTNAAGCIGTGTATLTTHTPLTVTVNLTKPLCNGNSNGVITVLGSGGVSPYHYGLTPASGNTTGIFNGMAAGTYTFRITDNVGCFKDTTITLTQPPLLNATASSTAGTCNGNDGSITVMGSGGTPVYTYSIDDGITYQPTATFTVSGGSYPNIRVKDSKGCEANTAAAVTLIDNMSALVIGNDTTICVEQQVTFQPQVSQQASVFTWTTSPASQLNTLNDAHIKNAIATPADTTNYILNAQWGVCSRTDTIKINVLHKPIPYAGRDTAVCYDKTIAVLHGSATNLSGTINYLWSDTTNLQTPHQAVTVATPAVTETFTLTVTDNYGCNFSETDQVVVKVQPPVPAFAGNDTIAVLGQPHQLTASGGVAYTWTPAAPLNLATIQNPLATLNNDQMFTVIVTDEAGCVGTDNIFVQVYEGPTYHVPNAFSPNGDGLNDIFRVVPPGISYTEWFRIFNRYGEMVFETNQWLKGWDGTYKGKPQPIDNYVWVIKGMNKFGKSVEMKGTVILVR